MQETLGSIMSAGPQDDKASIRAVSRFETLNKEQWELIDLIECRLHSLLNKRIPEKTPSNETVKPMIQDFFSSVDNQLSLLDNNNRKLRLILRHLEEIV